MEASLFTEDIWCPVEAHRGWTRQPHLVPFNLIFFYNDSVDENKSKERGKGKECQVRYSWDIRRVCMLCLE